MQRFGTCRSSRLVVALALAAVACTQPRTQESRPSSSDSEYVLYDGPDWTLKRAVNPVESDPVMSKVEPSLDWFAEFQRRRDIEPGVSYEVRQIRLSGHRASLDSLRAELRGITLESKTVNGRSGMAGQSPDGRPSIVAYEVGDGYAVMVLSHEVGLDELMSWTRQLKRVSESEWTESGGTFWTPMPTP